MKGNVSAIKKITDRIEGRVAQHIERKQIEGPARQESIRPIWPERGITPTLIDRKPSERETQGRRA